jgi:hypothetical protein
MNGVRKIKNIFILILASQLFVDLHATYFYHKDKAGKILSFLPNFLSLSHCHASKVLIICLAVLTDQWKLVQNIFVPGLLIISL